MSERIICSAQPRLKGFMLKANRLAGGLKTGVGREIV